MLLLLLVYAPSVILRVCSDCTHSLCGPTFFHISVGHKHHEEQAAKSEDDPVNAVTLPDSPPGRNSISGAASPSNDDMDVVISAPPMTQKPSIAQSMEEHGREKTMEMIMDEVLTHDDDSDDGTKPRTLPVENDGVFEAFKHVDTFMNLNVYQTPRTPAGSDASQTFPDTLKLHQNIPSTASSFKE